MFAIEHDLFMEWMEWLQRNHPKHGFMYDGIVCQDVWDAAPKHILFVLKDYNEKRKDRKPFHLLDINKTEDRKELFNLRSHLQWHISGRENWRTWDNAARWIYGLMHLTADYYPSFSEADQQGDAKHRSNNLKKVAVIDIKKKPGKSSCNLSQLNRYFKEYPESYYYLARQIALYGKLDFVVCCGDGIFEHFNKIAKQEVLGDNYTPKASSIVKNDYYISENGTIVINFIHPLLLKKGLRKDKEYKRLMEIAQKALSELDH